MSKASGSGPLSNPVYVSCAAWIPLLGAPGVGGEAIGRAAEFIDQCVVPILGELAGDAEPRAARVDAAVEVLHGRESGSRLVIDIIADVEMHPAGQEDRVSPVGALQPETVSRGLRDVRRG